MPGTMRGTVGSLRAGPVTDLRVFVTIVCRICAKTAHAAPRVRRCRMRVLVVTNMYPSRERPWLGPFVRDQVEALRRRDDLEVELFAFGPGPRNLVGAAVNLRAPLPRPALRHRPRALRAHRLARAALPARPGRRDAARQRPARAPLLRRDARGAAVHRADRGGLARVQREHPGRGRPSGASRCCPSASTRRASGRSREREARERLGLDPDAPVPAVPARPVAAAEALRPGRRGRGRRRAADPRRRPAGRGARTGSTPPTPCSCRRRRRASGWR